MMLENMLPKIAYPTHGITLPSTGESMVVRPFITREEKILLMATMSENVEDQKRAVKQVVTNCIMEWPESKKSVEQLSTFDIDYIFLQLRIHSIGDEVTVFFQGIEESECEECQKIREVAIDLKQVQVTKLPDKKDFTIMVTEDCGLKMKFVSVKEMEEFSKIALDPVDAAFELTTRYIESVFDSQNVVPVTKENRAQIKAWLEELPANIFEKVQKFIQLEPAIRHTIVIECPKCKHTQQYTFEGVDSFFV